MCGLLQGWIVVRFQCPSVAVFWGVCCSFVIRQAGFVVHIGVLWFWHSFTGILHLCGSLYDMAVRSRVVSGWAVVGGGVWGRTTGFSLTVGSGSVVGIVIFG